MGTDKQVDNQKAALAAKDPEYREKFLAESEDHILRLASKILKKGVTKSDDEWSVAFIAANEALEKYDEEKGDFWGFAAFVIKSRLLDLYRKEGKRAPEISVSPDAFSGELEEDDAQADLKLKIRDEIGQTSEEIDNSLRDEINALKEELDIFGISFFDISNSPRTSSTRKTCAQVIKAIFLPPPLVELIRKTKLFPAKEVMQRQKVSRKFIDKYRKYLITSTLILDGDYPGLSEYVSFLKQD